MIKYEQIDHISIPSDGLRVRHQHHEEIVHMDDPALAVMTDFSLVLANTINQNETIDNALNEMKLHGVHMLLATDDEQTISGIISSEDLLGEKPIKLLQHSRVERSNITVKMLMTTIKDIIAFDIDTIQQARVGNIVTTMKAFKQHYALVLRTKGDNAPFIRGLFSTSQISKQLHKDIASLIFKAESISELQKRSTRKQDE